MFRSIVFQYRLSLFLLATVLFSYEAIAANDFTEIYDSYSKGDFETVVESLEKVNPIDKKENGLIHYWKGLAYVKLNDFDYGTKNLRKAIDLGYLPDDIYYEYGQALYVTNDYKNAQIAFKKSFNRKFKRGVSLYYIATIAKEQNQTKSAVKFFKMIAKLPEEEKRDVLQASRVQIADIYLEKIENLPDSIKDIEKYVIPQYREALEVDSDSKLAEEIKLKIEELERKYELVLFRMRNGRPTARPPYYIRTYLLYGTDDNVYQLNDVSRNSLELEDVASPFVRAGTFGRYSFYPNSAFSIAPELSVSTTRYLSDSESIQALNSYDITTGTTLNFEHIYNENPATFYVNLAYTYNADYGETGEDFTYAGNEISLTLSEELRFWADHPSVFRLRYRNVTSENVTESYNAYTVIWEQIISVNRTILFFTNSYTLNSYRDPEAKESSHGSISTRLDLIFPTFLSLFNPTLYGSYTNNDYFEDSSTGAQNITTYGLNLNRPITKNLYVTLDYGINSQDAENESDTFNQNTFTVNLDYIY